MDKLKPSQYLRLGSKQIEQAYCQYLHSNHNVVDKACPLGMMAVARAGTLDSKECCKALAEIMDMLPSKYIDHIVDMNDRVLKTPKEIADWLEEKGY
jgi:hypothetical protein